MNTLRPTTIKNEDEEEEAYNRPSMKKFKVFLANANDNYIIRVYKTEPVPSPLGRPSSVVVLHGDETDGRGAETKNQVEVAPRCHEAIDLGATTQTKQNIWIQAVPSKPGMAEGGNGTPFTKEITDVDNKTGFIFTKEMEVLTARKGHFIRNWWTAEDGRNFRPSQHSQDE